MNDEAHVGVFYSAGRDLDAVMRQAAARFPDGRITLLLPPELAEARRNADPSTEIITTPSVRSVGDFLRLVRLLRRHRFSDFITCYPSRRLRLLAAVSGARRCASVDEQGRWTPLSASLALALLGAASNEVRGHVAWLRVWLVVRFQRVRPGEPSPRR